MTFDAALADRVRDLVTADPRLDGRDVSERRMFGGLAFLLDGNMACVVRGKGGFMVRLDPATTAELVESTPADYMEMRGRPMKGWLQVSSADVGSDDDLRFWFDMAVDFTTTLPPKS